MTSDLHGQLGNQLFQIAAATSLALDHDAEAIFPDLRSKRGEEVSINYRKVFWRCTAKEPDEAESYFYREPYYHYHPIPYIPNIKMHGHFQSEKYFKHHKEEILELFAPSNGILLHLKQKYGKILDHPCVVALHVRTLFLHPSQSLNYFEKAMREFPSYSLFIICSDDIQWCKREMNHLPFNMLFIENEPHYIDFYLMSRCKHNIISNSTFSWWAAYLNPNPDKIVIAPPLWFTPGWGGNHNTKDIYPDEWTVLTLD